MRTSISGIVLASYFFLCLVLFVSGCIDALEPAGPAEYENPDYPSNLFGYAVIPSSFSDAFCHNERAYVFDRWNKMMISFSLLDQNLADPDSIVLKDTLLLGFPPGLSCFDDFSETVFITDDISNDVYRLPLSSSGPPELLCQCESILTDILTVDNGNSLLLCFLGPEWLVRKVNSVTGEVEDEFFTGWPISRVALSVDEEKLLLNNSGRKYLIEIDTDSFEKVDSISVPERIGPFLYNTSGNIIIFNQYTVDPRVYLVDGNTKSILDVINSINPYKYCFLMSGTDVVLAPRRSDNRVSILNSENMIFAPSILCFSYAEIAVSTSDNNYIVVFSDSPGRAYVYDN